ncbi:MAG: sugar phosphate isomerase/epimerase [Bacteroidales bacterium]|jgi:sugar phosphate isomerase/epimerase|nr:sugar phosphate isomerase/epimerase [Bacteroidales bacterium]MCU0407574.1 sugar phosphate isomerase/epimerase [Bacteroidales bacterium]
MKRITRRDFLGKSALGIGSALLSRNLMAGTVSAGEMKKVKMPLGFQVWTIREKLVKDFPGTLKEMSGLGYKTVEMCSAPGYAMAGFAPLANMKAAEMKKIVEDAGLKLESTHYVMNELRNNLDERIAFAAETGQKQMILSSFGLPAKATMSDWMKAADELNAIGARTKAAGIQTGFHNHHGEFGKIDGVLIYDELLKQFDPELVKMQFQVAVVSIGYKAADYFNKYPGRFISAHLADWSESEKKSVVLGKGIVDWNEFFAAVKKGGAKNIFVEMDPETFAGSAAFINSL